MRSLYVTLVYVAFLVLGVAAPFAFSLGYVWVDAFSPQSVVYSVLNDIPVSLVMGICAVGSYVLFDRRAPRFTFSTWLLVGFAIWITLSTFLWAEVPAAAYGKWNVAFKTMLFTAFMPLVFRSRVQIEAFLQVWVFSLAVQFIPFGAKSMISGGGYGQNLGVTAGNSLLSEGSTLAGVCMMIVPILLYFRGNTILLPRTRLVMLMYLGLTILSFSAVLGTYERTGVVGMIVVGIGLWIRSRRKVVTGLAAIIGLFIVINVTSSQWKARIETTTHYQKEDSALGRILVWKWTLNYVTHHPQGGGFNDYIIDRIVFPPDPDGKQGVVHGKAFHSIYFEVLGEQGWVGLAFFLGLAMNSILQLQSVARRAKHAKDTMWAREMAVSLQIGLITLMTCGAFIGIAFQPMLYYLFAASSCLKNYMDRALTDKPDAITSGHWIPPSAIPARIMESVVS